MPKNGVEVLSIPGCCAAVNALAVSGLPTGRFTFEGFLTVNKKSRRERLDSLKNEERTMIFHEAPHKLRATLEDLRETFGPDRRVGPVPGADEAPRGDCAHHPGRSGGLLPGKHPQGRIRAGGGGQPAPGDRRRHAGGEGRSKSCGWWPRESG